MGTSPILDHDQNDITKTRSSLSRVRASTTLPEAVITAVGREQEQSGTPNNTQTGSDGFASKSKGGRPRVTVTADQALILRARGLSVRQVASRLRIGTTTAFRLLRAAEPSVKAFQNTGKTFPNRSSGQARETAALNHENAATGLETPGSRQSIAPDPSGGDDAMETILPLAMKTEGHSRTRTLQFHRRVAAVVCINDDLVAPINGGIPGRCQRCGSRAWRLRADGKLDCNACQPLDTF